MPFSIGPTEGVNFAQVFAISSTTPEYPAVPLAAGTHVFGDSGAEWVLCQVQSTKSVTAGDLVVVTNHATWQIDQLVNATAKNFLGSRVGVAGATAASGQYVWVQVSGYAASVNIATSSTAFTAMHSGATAGRGTTTGSAGNSAAISGLVALATAASNAAPCFLNFATVGAND